MKLLPALLITFLPVIIFGQQASKNTQQRKVSRFAGSINFSPHYSYRNLKSDGSSGANTVIKLREAEEISKISYSAGLGICYKFHRQFGIETGIQYSNKGYQTKKILLEYGGVPDPSYPTHARY